MTEPRARYGQPLRLSDVHIAQINAFLSRIQADGGDGLILLYIWDGQFFAVNALTGKCETHKFMSWSWDKKTPAS